MTIRGMRKRHRMSAPTLGCEEAMLVKSDQPRSRPSHGMVASAIRRSAARAARTVRGCRGNTAASYRDAGRCAQVDVGMTAARRRDQVEGRFEDLRQALDLQECVDRAVEYDSSGLKSDDTLRSGDREV